MRLETVSLLCRGNALPIELQNDTSIVRNLLSAYCRSLYGLDPPLDLWNIHWISQHIVIKPLHLLSADSLNLTKWRNYGADWSRMTTWPSRSSAGPWGITTGSRFWSLSPPPASSTNSVTRVPISRPTIQTFSKSKLK